MTKHKYKSWLHEAYLQAQKSLSEGGLPIGSVLVDGNGTVISKGHNQRVQNNDPTAHAEVSCIRNAGRRRDWHECTLVSTLSPCIMCTGTSLLFKISKVIIGENKTFMGAEDLFLQHGVEIINLNDSACIKMMTNFIADRPDLWNEDIGIPPGQTH